MVSIPVSAYDVLGIFSCGAVLVGGLQLLTGFPPVFGQPLTPFDAGAALLSIYIAGHLIASPAKVVLEDWLVHRVLGSPERVLFHGARSWHAKMLFPGYHAPLANHVIARCRERATEDGIVVDDVGELFQLARNSEHVTGDAQTMARLETFLGLYGFARNISFACLFLAPLLVVSARLSHRPHILDFAIAATVIGVAFVYRFLMFYRLYSVAVFNRFGSTL